MVKMMRKEQIEQLSAEGRIKNSYESMYYRAQSGDPESDGILKDEIQHSFRRRGVILADNPDHTVLRDIMLDAYKQSTKELGGESLSPDREKNLVRNFDAFTANHPSFYTKTFDSFESKYEGETVDFHADYDRMVQDNDGVNPLQTEPTEADLNVMQRDLLKQFSREGEMKAAGLSYAGHAPVTTPTRRSYQQVKQEELAAQEMKGNNYDKSYDTYIRGRGQSYQKTTAGDDYGFDERDVELEDDGPEL